MSNRRYYITEEQFKDLYSINNRIAKISGDINELSESDNTELSIGFELGKMFKDSNECYHSITEFGKTINEQRYKGKL